MNCTGVARMNSHTAPVNQGRESNGTHVSTLAPAARPRNSATLTIERIRTPESATVARRFMSFNALSGSSKALAHASMPVSYTHLRAHETPEHLVCRLLLEKKKK